MPISEIQQEINSLVSERKALISTIQKSEIRIHEIEGAISTLVKLFGNKEKENDSEDKVESFSDTDQG